MKGNGRRKQRISNGTVRFSELVTVNPHTPIPKRLTGASLVSFIPMADVSDSAQWMNRQTRPLSEVRHGFTNFADGDVLFAKITPCAENGKGAHVTDLVNGVGFGSTEFHVLRAKPDISPRLVFHIAKSPFMRETAIRMMVGSAGQQRVPSDAFSHFWINKSVLKNGERIAALLDAIDDDIESTRQLSEQTLRLMGALAQDLLVHAVLKKRFPIRSARLGQLFTERTEPGRAGLPTMSVTMNDGIVDREDMDRRVESELTPQEHLLARKGDIAYNMMRMWQGVSGLVPHDSLVSPAYVVVTPTKEIDAEFAAHLFKLPETIRLLRRYSQGLTEDRLRLYYHQFAEIQVSIPKDKAQQNRIAHLLTTLANTAEAHEARLAALVRTKTAISNKIFSTP